MTQKTGAHTLVETAFCSCCCCCGGCGGCCGCCGCGCCCVVVVVGRGLTKLPCVCPHDATDYWHEPSMTKPSMTNTTVGHRGLPKNSTETGDSTSKWTESEKHSENTVKKTHRQPPYEELVDELRDIDRRIRVHLHMENA